MTAKKNDIIQKLKAKGLLIDASIERELLTAYSVFLQRLVDEEYTLLEEILRIQEKIEAKEELTYLEEVFFKYVQDKYFEK